MPLVKKKFIVISIFILISLAPTKAEELKKLENLRIGKLWF